MRSIIAYIGLLFFFIGCSDTNTSSKKFIVFNKEAIEKEYVHLCDDEQWLFLVRVMQSSYTNPNTVESWLLEKIKQKKRDTSSLTANIILDLNKAVFKTDNTQLVLAFAYFTLAHSSKNQWEKASFFAAANLADYYNTSKQKDSVSKYIKLMAPYVKKNPLPEHLLVYYANKANLESMKGAYFEAAVAYHKAIDVTAPSEKYNLGTLYHNLALMYLNMNYVTKAKTYIDSSLVYIPFETYPDHFYNSLGVIQSKSSSFREAEQTFQKTLHVAKVKKNSYLLAQTYANYGNLKRRQKKYREALHYIHLSDSLCTRLGLHFGKVVNYVNRAEVYYEQQKYPLALEQLTTITKDVTNFDLPEVNIEYYNLLYRIYDALGNESLANSYYRKYNYAKETIVGDLPRSVISEWQLARERERRIALNLRVDKQLKTSYFYAFIIALLLLGFVLIYFLVKRKIFKLQLSLELEQQKKTYELELKSKELLSSSLQNIELQQSKIEIKELIEKIVLDLPVEHQNRFKKLIKKLGTTSTNSFLIDFEKRFIGVYESFYDNIKVIAPDLTSNEMMICAMLRLNFSSKEIAFLTNRTARTIENNRSIIRKKLQLDADVNLQLFLKSI